MSRPERSDDLTPEQVELAGLLAYTELSVPVIARRMDAAPSTTRYRVQSLYERLGVNSRRGLREVWLDCEFAPVEANT
jgi:DNA-binding NarL/FixJ family response regulator